MSFLSPLFLLLGLLAGPIILLYMLRLRRQEMKVSSTLLWRKLLRDREANAPWQRLRRNLLLILQLLILAALALALARPSLPVPAVVGGNVVVVLDASASMQATDVPPNRFQAAKTAVEGLIRNLGGDDRMTLILAGSQPTALISASAGRDALRRALDAAQVEGGEADWQAAMALAAGAAQGYRQARIAIVSDGGLSGDLPQLPAEAVYIPIGSSGENLALSALATRDTPDGPQLFASVTNYGQKGQRALLSLTVDGGLFDSRRVELDAGNVAAFTWTLPAGSQVIEARLSGMEIDSLAADDSAWAVHQGGLRRRALIVTPGNLFLEQAYTVMPGIEAFKSGPDFAPAPEESEPFDLYLFDSVPLPAPLPDADLLLINPPQGYATLFDRSGTFTNTATVRVADNPVLQFVDWSQVNVRRAQAISAPWMQSLVEAEGGPLLLAGDRGGRRLAILTFDLHDSDLPLQIAFPVLMANLTAWLTPGRAFPADARLRPGEPLPLTPPAAATEVLVTRPDGQVVRLEPAGPDLLFADTGQPGLYQVAVGDEGGVRPAGTFAVNLFSAQESQVAPATSLNLGQEPLLPAAQEAVGQRELWPWLAALALATLLLEWWVHFRGPTLDFLRRRKRPQINVR